MSDREDILGLSNKLMKFYGCFWGIAIFVLLLFELDILPTGGLVENKNWTYIFQTMTILITIAEIPGSLKYFSKRLKLIDKEKLELAIHSYLQTYTTFLILLDFVAVIGLICYYLTLNSTGGLCAIIALITSFYHMPTRQKIQRDLHIEKE